MKTKDEVRNWLVANVGARHVTYDSNGNSIGAQCVGLINAFTDWLGYPRIPGLYAFELFDNAKQFSEYEVIPNSATFVPQLGDILVYAEGSFGSSVGHVEIAGDNSTLNVVDALAQNYLNPSATKGSPAAWVKHGYGDFLGAVRPRLMQRVKESVAAESAPQKEKVTMVDEAGLNVLYKFYLASPITDYGYKNRLGKQTFAQAQREIMESAAAKALVKKRAEEQTGFINHLPDMYKAVVKLPEQVNVEPSKG
ncbi:hypothetical protein AB0280_15560 [Pseudarthrobacter sp902506025]|uniref:hypothetical protein n=1 Tax=Pseudarthrobacter sp. 902506025 TaxID=3155291 RepID=UPI00344D56F6